MLGLVRRGVGPAAADAFVRAALRRGARAGDIEALLDGVLSPGEIAAAVVRVAVQPEARRRHHQAGRLRPGDPSEKAAAVLNRALGTK